MTIWKDSYLIGDQQIDEQHKQLILLTEDLLKIQHDNTADQRNEGKQAISFLKDYASVHFQAEEIFMKSIGFDELERHRELHEEFSEWLLNFEFELMRQDYNPSLLRELTDKLVKWWIYHIIKEDRKMKKFIK